MLPTPFIAAIQWQSKPLVYCHTLIMFVPKGGII